MTVSFQDQYHDWNGSQTRAQPILQRRKIETVFRIPRDNSHKMIEPTPVGRIVTLQVSWPRARFTIWIIGSRQKHLTCGEISILFLTHESTTSSFNRNMVSTSWPASLNRYRTIIRRINIPPTFFHKIVKCAKEETKHEIPNHICHLPRNDFNSRCCSILRYLDPCYPSVCKVRYL